MALQADLIHIGLDGGIEQFDDGYDQPLPTSIARSSGVSPSQRPHGTSRISAHTSWWKAVSNW